MAPQPTGEAGIAEEAGRPRIVARGVEEDAATRNLLLQAAQASGDPLLRMDSVVILARSGDSPEVRQVLIHALRGDPNPAVRLKAVEALAAFADRPEVRRALAEALLQDEHVGVRAEAIHVLRQNPDLTLEGVLRQVAARESNEYIRAQSRLMLEAIDSTLETF
jgi:HEAT repeat protein